MTTARLRQLVAEYLHKAELNDKVISPHSLRHSAAISWLRTGASVVAVQKLLGHASLSTTQKYVDHLELRDLKKVVNRPATASRSRANQA
jgi:integrase/recombinase XerD